MIGNPMLWGGADPLDEFGRVERSIRFRRAATAVMTRTPAVAGNRRVATFGLSVKRGELGVMSGLLGAGVSGVGQTGAQVMFNADNTLRVFDVSVWNQTDIYTFDSVAMFRDPSAHLDIHVALDSTKENDAERLMVWVNGELLAFNPATKHLPAKNAEGTVNNAVPHCVGAGENNTGRVYGDNVISLVYVVDGQALPPTAFGLFHPCTGQWRPKSAAAVRAAVAAGGGTRGGWGTNGGLWLFDDPTSLATLGYDRSQGDTAITGNNLTATGVSLADGATYDSLIDTPTNNFATLNPLSKTISHSAASLADGNLRLSAAGEVNATPGSYALAAATISIASGKIYVEATGIQVSGSTGKFGLGVSNQDNLSQSNIYIGNISAVAKLANAGTTLRLCIDAEAGKVWTGTDTGWDAGDPAMGTGGTTFPGPYTVFAEAFNDTANRVDVVVNFGQRAFAGSVPVGFKTLCSKNLPRPSGAALSPRQHFDTLLWAGDGKATQSIRGAAFQPDFVWTKNRGASTDHALYDSVRGPKLRLRSNQAVAENSEGVESFDEGGLTVNNAGAVNNSAASPYVGWLWRAGGPAVINTRGSIPSQLSTNRQAGFSVVSYTGNGVVGATVGHGLSVAPALVIIKNRDTADTAWPVWHASLAAGQFLTLQTGNVAAADFPYFNGVPPTSDLLTLPGTGQGNALCVNELGKRHIAYCFAEVRGFSRIGAYIGNGSVDGPFVYCGFKPAFVLIKNTASASSDWEMYDAVRDPYNVVKNIIYPNKASAETVMAGDAITPRMDMCATGFKVRTTGGGLNAAGAKFIFLAIAGMPQRYANAR